MPISSSNEEKCEQSAPAPIVATAHAFHDQDKMNKLLALQESRTAELVAVQSA